MKTANPALQTRNILRGIKRNKLTLQMGSFINAYNSSHVCLMGAIAVNVLGHDQTKILGLKYRSTGYFDYIPELAKILNVSTDVLQSMECGLEGNSYYNESFKRIPRYVKLGQCMRKYAMAGVAP